IHTLTNTSFTSVHVHSIFTSIQYTIINTLSLHDALPIYGALSYSGVCVKRRARKQALGTSASTTHIPPCQTSLPGCAKKMKNGLDRKSTRLNSSHQIISYAVL